MSDLLSPLLRPIFLLPLLTLTLFPPLDPLSPPLTTALVRASSPEPFQVEVFASGLGSITAFTFTPDGRLFYTDSYHKTISILDHAGKPLERIPIPQLSGRDSQVLGLALDPDFVHNGILYVHYLESDGWSNRVVRFRYQNGHTSAGLLLLDLPLPPDPANPDQPCTDHNGGHIVIGPDGSLYVPMGDNCQQELAQNLTVLQGKILRIRRTTGAGLPGNPFYDQDSPNDDRIWAWGVRNPFGSAIDPATGDFWLADNGPACGDEINHVIAGGNYGWPLSSPSYTECVDPGPDDQAPAWHWDVTIAPTGLEVYEGNALPNWQDSILACNWNTSQLYVLRLDPTHTGIASQDIIDVSPAACQIDIEAGPDGAIYFSDMTTIYRLNAYNLRLPLVLLPATTSERIDTTASRVAIPAKP